MKSQRKNMSRALSSVVFSIAVLGSCSSPPMVTADDMYATDLYKVRLPARFIVVNNYCASLALEYRSWTSFINRTLTRRSSNR